MLTRQENVIHGVFTTAKIFDGLTGEAISHLALSFHQREYSRGSFLFLEDEPAQTYYLIAEGRVKITQISADGFQVILHVLGSGDLVGALPTLGEGNYPASAEALSDLVVFAIEASSFDNLLLEHSVLALNLLRFATGKLQATHVRLREMATERVERRIARTLGRMASQIGKRIESGILLDAPLSRQDLAEMSGTTLFTVSRTLKNWERNGWLNSGRTKLIIKNPHALAIIAEDLPQKSSENSPNLR